MNKLSFRPVLAVAVAAVCLLPIQTTLGQISAPVGNLKLQTKAGSDTNLSIPFTRPSEFTGVVNDTSGNNITINGPGVSANRFVYVQGTQPNHYYVYFGPSASGNPKEGRRYDIVANSTNTFTLNLNGDSLGSSVDAAQFSVIPHWTLGTLFPASKANISFTPTTSSSAYQTEIVVPNYSYQGSNPPVSSRSTFFYSNNIDGTSNNMGWRLLGDNADSQNDSVLIPDGYIIVRNLNSAPGLPLNTYGNVVTGKLSIPLATLSNNAQDNFVSLTRPVPVTLNNSGLNNTDSSFISTIQPGGRYIKDQLELYSSVLTGYDNSPPYSYIYFNGTDTNGQSYSHWRMYSDNTGLATDNGLDTIPPGSGFFIRKYPTTGGLPAFWTNTATY